MLTLLFFWNISLTKWSEVFATPDQTSLTIVELLMKKVISRHGVPTEFLSAFLV